MRVRLLPILLVLVLCAGGCTPFSDDPRPADGQLPHGRVPAPAPDERLTVLADADPVASAAAMSRTLFDRSPVVVVARDGDRPGTLLAASAAVGLGVPLLLEPEDGGTSEALAGELVRLGAGTVLAVGETGDIAADGNSGAAGHDVVAVPADAEAVAAATGLDFAPADPVSSHNDPVAVAALDPAAPVALQLEHAAAGSIDRHRTAARGGPRGASRQDGGSRHRGSRIDGGPRHRPRRGSVGGAHQR